MLESDALFPPLELNRLVKAAPCLTELLLQGEQAAPVRQRPVWTALVRDSHQSFMGLTGCPERFYALPDFYERLGEAVELDRRLGQPLGVVVLQLPELKPPDRERRQRELEVALRLSVRQDDLPARLAPGTLAVGLPHTGTSVGVVALRLQRVLTRLAGRRVTVATACLPADGTSALDLLRLATWRSLTAMPGAHPDPELTRLLGPIAATEVVRPSTHGEDSRQ